MPPANQQKWHVHRNNHQLNSNNINHLLHPNTPHPLDQTTQQ
jgi:hypothetical protein